MLLLDEELNIHTILLRDRMLGLSLIHIYRFVTHLKFYARRIVSGEGYGDEDSDLLDVVRFKYPKAYALSLIHISRYRYRTGSRRHAARNQRGCT